MKITLDLPEYDNPGHREYEVDGYDHKANLCAGCGDELYGLTVRLLPLGWLHAEAEEDAEGRTCQEKAVEKLLADPHTAWLAVAKHVAKYPSKHSVSAIRTVITELAKLAEHRPVTVPPCHCGQSIPRERVAYCSDRCRWADDDHGPNGDDQ